jgi:hypothetical protein
MPTSAAPGDQPHLLVVDDAAERGACIADVAKALGLRCGARLLLQPATRGTGSSRLAGAAGAHRGCLTMHGGQRRW